MDGQVFSAITYLGNIKTLACKLSGNPELSKTKLFLQGYGWVTIDLATLYSWLLWCCKQVHARDLEDDIRFRMSKKHLDNRVYTMVECAQIILWANAMSDHLDHFPIRNPDGSPEYNPSKKYWVS